MATPVAEAWLSPSDLHVSCTPVAEDPEFLIGRPETIDAQPRAALRPLRRASRLLPGLGASDWLVQVRSIWKAPDTTYALVESRFSDGGYVSERAMGVPEGWSLFVLLHEWRCRLDLHYH